MSDWMTIRVVLNGQPGETIARPPGRVMLAHADHSFSDLAEATDTAFGRWDLTPVSSFEVEGRILLSPGAGGEGDVDAEDSDEVTIGEVGLRAGARFTYQFDLGEGWTHECTVEDVGIDPFELTGEEPDVPVPVFGWGTVPDQYGRVSEDDEDDEDVGEGGVEDPEDLMAPEEDEDDEDQDDDPEAWEAAEAASWAVVSKALADVDAEPDEDALRRAVADLRSSESKGWQRDLLWAASGLDPEESDGEETEVWLDLAAAVVHPGIDLPIDTDVAASWASLELADWAGAVIELVRSGPGTPATPESVIELIARCPEVDSEDLTDEDEAAILEGLEVVVELWQALGAVDEDAALTTLGRWGLPRALERAWSSGGSA